MGQAEAPWRQVVLGEPYRGGGAGRSQWGVGCGAAGGVEGVRRIKRVVGWTLWPVGR